MINLPVQFGEANEKGLYSSLLPPQKKEIIQEMFTYTGRLREAVTWKGLMALCTEGILQL